MASIQEAYDVAIRLHRAGDLRQAETIYRQILQADPSHADALHFAGVIAMQSGQPARAVEIISRSIALRPNIPAFHQNLGAAYQTLGKLAEAIAAFENAQKLQPANAEILSQLAGACFQHGDFKRTEAYCLAGLKLKPDHSELWNTQGNLRRSQGRLDDAVTMFRRAVQINPRHAAAHNNLACALQTLRRPKDAIVHYRQALALNPNYADAHSNLAILLSNAGELDEAETHLREAVRLQPKIPHIRKNLGSTLQLQGKFDEAIACFSEAEAMAGGDPRAASNVLLCMNYDPKVATPMLFAAHERWGSAYGKAPVSGPSPTHDRDPNRKLRIGYVSSNLCTHPLVHFFEPILTHHDASQVDVICYSEMPMPDGTTARLKAVSPGWRDIFGQSDINLANLIRADRIDILVDLTGHTYGNRLTMFAQKPAPVQINYLGYPYTSGLTTIDYRLTDSIADPEGEPVSYTEELVRLPSGFSCFGAGEDVPDVAPSPAARKGYVTFGSLHNTLRLNSEVLETWGEILRAVPSSRMLICRDTIRGTMRNKIIRAFKNQGISADRLELRNQPPKNGNYLSVYDDVDISLDTFPWSGHTTGCHALWMGVPVITLSGERHIGRMIASVLHQIGLERLIAKSKQDYVALAGQLAGDMEALAALRGKLRPQMAASPLCDYSGFTRNLEETYRQLWRRSCAVGA